MQNTCFDTIIQLGKTSNQICFSFQFQVLPRQMALPISNLNKVTTSVFWLTIGIQFQIYKFKFWVKVAWYFWLGSNNLLHYFQSQLPGFNSTWNLIQRMVTWYRDKPGKNNWRAPVDSTITLSDQALWFLLPEKQNWFEYLRNRWQCRREHIRTELKSLFFPG
jgi:hypothetical protein